jgi:hypothetical protein
MVRTRLILCQCATCNASNGGRRLMYKPVGDLAVDFSANS